MINWFKERRKKKLHQARMWHEAITMLGVSSDLEKLEKIALRGSYKANIIPYKALFSDTDLFYITNFHGNSGLTSSALYRGKFSFDTIESAVHAKKMIAYIQETEKAMALLSKDELVHLAPPLIREKWKTLKQEKAKAIREVMQVSEQDYHSTVISFTKTAILPEEQLLELVDTNLKERKDVEKKMLHSGHLESQTMTSPALVELNQFLNENRLPDDVYQELKHTIQDIEVRLRSESVEETDEQLRMEADIINQAAKQYHQL